MANNKQLRRTLILDPTRAVGEQKVVEKVTSLGNGSKSQEWLRKSLMVGLAIENCNPACFEMLATYSQLDADNSISEEKLLSFFRMFSCVQEPEPKPEPEQKPQEDVVQTPVKAGTTQEEQLEIEIPKDEKPRRKRAAMLK